MERLAEIGRVAAVSSLYETTPVGGPEQPDYLNAVIVLDTEASPRAVLDHCLAVERERGRERRERWAPRTLDLDVLVAGETRIEEPGLVVPHPRLAERRFVLAPLAEVWPGALPDGRRPSDLLSAVAGQAIRRVAGPGWARSPALRRPAALAAGAVLAVAGLAAAAWSLARRR